ncbi:hypothetical protein SASPL_122529 [Salvia splendens]|uniref:HMA domain-containing protein n=1 Tax=Salvia splendens TaxID=180675 RepID=A0A8X8ZR98_SALSN|nr:heavy metal-associated isoprenylated plant protein 3-like [Salvia splendens]KAG6415127.1 hypothetical protein SASPL_122529 [Salvia splendens]
MGEKKEKDNGRDTVVLKADFHCDGCASNVIKCIRAFNGVKAVTIDGQKITVTGKVDAVKLRQKVEQKTHQKVEVISPQPKKDENAEKEAALRTAVLKLNLHCDGCIEKIYKIVAKTKGYKDVKFDTQKDLVTVSGAMDVEALAGELQKHLKRDVAIVPPKKEKSGGDGKGKSGGGENVQGKELQAPPHPHPHQHTNPYPFESGLGHAAVEPFQLQNPYGGHFHAPQIFSDENPNACTLM